MSNHSRFRNYFMSGRSIVLSWQKLPILSCEFCHFHQKFPARIATIFPIWKDHFGRATSKQQRENSIFPNPPLARHRKVGRLRTDSHELQLPKSAWSSTDKRLSPSVVEEELLLLRIRRRRSLAPLGRLSEAKCHLQLLNETSLGLGLETSE